MPIPKPKPDESKEEFMERCMDDEVMKKEYPDNDQRLGVCFGQWGKKERKMNREKTSEYEERIINPQTLEIRAKGEDGGSKIAGYAAKFNEISEELWGFKEKISPGAFDDVLGNDVRATQNHDPNRILGRSTKGTLRLDQDETGLKIEIDPPETTWAEDLLVNMRRGDVDQMSFQFRVAEDGDQWAVSPEGEWLRTITKVSELRDVSVVAFPAYPQTTAEVRTRFNEVQKKEHPEKPPRVLDREKEIRLKRMRMKLG